MLLGLYGLIFCSILTLNFYQLLPANSLYDTVYTFLEYSFFTAILWNNVATNKFRVVILICSLLFISAQVITFTISKTDLDSIPIGIETILIFVYIIFFFYQNFRNNYDQYIYDHHCFWISIGMLIYLGGTFFFNLLANHIDPVQIDRYWYLTHIADIIKNLFFCVAIIVYDRSKSKERLYHHSSVPYLDLDMN